MISECLSVDVPATVVAGSVFAANFNTFLFVTEGLVESKFPDFLIYKVRFSNLESIDYWISKTVASKRSSAVLSCGLSFASDMRIIGVFSFSFSFSS